MVPLPRTLRQDHDETSAAPALRRAARLAAVPPRNLPHEREAEASTLPRADAVERLEHAVALGLRYARAAIADRQLRAVPDAGDAYLDRRSAVALRVFQQVADHPAQQPRIAAQGEWLAVELGVVVASAFFRGKREQVHTFIGFQLLQGVKAAGKQDLVDQRIEFGDILLQLGFSLRLGVLFHQFHRHADARERRAQLVRSVREQRLVRSDQLLDAARRPVEALGEPRHLVASLDLDARRELARG